MNRKQKDKKQKLNELGDGVYAAEKLLKKRKQRGQIEYLVKWKGWSDKDNTWEPIGNIIDKRLIQEFEQSNKNENSNKSLSRSKKTNNRLSLEDEKIKTLNKDILDNENSNSSSKSDDTIENTDLNESQVENRSLKEIQIEEHLKEEIKKDKLDKKEVKIEIKELEIKIPSENNIEVTSNVKSLKKNEKEEIENKESKEKILPEALTVDTNFNKNEVNITKSKIEIKENKTEKFTKENIATKTESNKVNENKNETKLEIIPVVNLNKTKTLCEKTLTNQPVRFNDKINLPKKEQEVKEQPALTKPIISNTSSTITNNFNQLVNNKQLANSIQSKNQFTIVNVPTINQQNVLINKVSLPSVKPINLNSKSFNNGHNDDSISNTENTLNFIKSVNPATKSSINLPKTTLNNSSVSISFSTSYTNNLINNLTTINSNLNSKVNSTNIISNLMNNSCNSIANKNSTPNLISNNIKKSIDLTKPIIKNKTSSPQIMPLLKSNETVNSKAAETTFKKIKSPIIKNINCNQDLKPITNNIVTTIPSLNVNQLLNNQKNNDLNKLEKTNELKKDDNKNQISNFKQISTAILQSKQKNIKRWSPPLEFWKKQSVLVNQVIVTDIKNNDNEIITIRESKTPHGFFKKKSVKKKKKLLSKNEPINGN